MAPPEAKTSGSRPVRSTDPGGGRRLELRAHLLDVQVEVKSWFPARIDRGERRVAVLRDVRRLPFVVQNEADVSPERAVDAASTAFWRPTAFVMSPSLWKTATMGGYSPVPKSFSVFWFVS